MSVKRASQKGLKPLALEVEAAADVLDDLGAGAALSEEGDLSLEVRLLAGGGDATVGDVDAIGGGSSDGVHGLSGYRLGVHGRLPCGEEGIDIVESCAAGGPDHLDATLVTPVAQRGNADP